MTLTTHTATGILVTQWTNNPVLGFVVAAISHYLTDALPHGDEWVYYRHIHNPKDSVALVIASIDLFVLCAIILAILNYGEASHLSVVIAAILGAVLPDIFITLHTKSHHHGRVTSSRHIIDRLRLAYYWCLDTHLRFHHFFHGLVHTPIRFRTGVLYQTLFIMAFVYYYL